ncbi:hypothetical protein XENTR_v10010426 [Xenopus tropicalis]|uniref:TSC22 domain family member 4 n=1 Tax=Xenopus tropicalis TaxID=8364 RepID=A0A803J9J9_XENTR|nr:TSC22 domain family protein 4 [Xenopus tropicalis]XP_031755463.1 TSC22 domain family protein 4 [Xenopus tropicalis]XP_031755464.1 TSC22 domain family protein 4 [Xenopus tropicalis]XP_031755465.1 TSC22 domain family protein 4 [Xenopus tropicalis]XP_031755466.1 TSC22 domain family protein 4 [Xenopus tropicalis]XP_031755467.1 TSC22 domain family protein 4 [Xenopus tropicalis]KAE8620702.1 hypothetical protein XENTR_v10010426 [Xenopus tropicalis]
MSLGKKRSGFQITSVTSDYQPSSPVSPVADERSASPTPTNGLRSPPTSRFRVVRLDQAPLGGGRRYKRGRWSCVEFYHPEVGSTCRAGAGHSLDSGLPRASPLRSPLLLSPGAGGKGPQAPRSQGAPVLGEGTGSDIRIERSPTQSPVGPPVSTFHPETPPAQRDTDDFTERLILARSVFCVGGDNDSVSSNSLVAIDNKIEQAMDLVKTHLLFAVREVVEILKEQIKDLTERNSHLEHENSLLRSLATPQQLSELQSRIQTSRKVADQK